MEFQKIFPSPDDIVGLQSEELGIRMLTVLRNWPEGHIFDLRELLARIAAQNELPVAFALASYPADRLHEIRGALERAWRWLEREGIVEPNSGGGSLSRLSKLGQELAALEPSQAILAVRNGRIYMLSKPGAIVAALAEKTELFNFSTVQHEISRALRSAKDDPEDAVTAACSLIESSMSIDLGPIESAAPAQQRYRWSYARGSRFTRALSWQNGFLQRNRGRHAPDTRRSDLRREGDRRTPYPRR